MNDQPHKVRVAVVFGGRSPEHEISCVTAGSVLAALDRDRYEVVPVGITREGRWVLAPDDPEKLAITGDRLPEVDESGATVALVGDANSHEMAVREPASPQRSLGDVDVVLPLLHGPYGEDGTIQGMLELADVPYVGSGVFASAASMDKHYMKIILTGHGLPVGPYAVMRPGEWESDEGAARETVAALGWPVFVKPARGGSSIGISKVTGPDGLAEAVALAMQHDPKVLVEAALDAREIECGVLEGLDGLPEASAPAEIRVHGHEFYDFEAKYLPDEGTDLDVPADLPEEVAEQVRRLAVAAFAALSCEGLARVDFFYTHDGRLVINELNTMPGFTPSSMYPRMWAASGVDYPALLDRLLQAALRRRTGLR